MNTDMNVSGAVSGLDFSSLTGGQQASSEGGGFMDILAQLVGNSSEDQLVQSLQILSQQTNEDDENKNVQTQLMNLIAEYLQIFPQTVADFSEAKTANAENPDVKNVVGSNIAQIQNKAVNGNQDTNLFDLSNVGEELNFQSLLNGLKNTENNLGSENSLESLMNFNDTDKNSFMQTVSSLTGNTQSDEAQTEAIPLVSALPLDAVYQLAKAQTKSGQAVNGNGYENRKDFSKLSVSEKLDVLKNAIENGEVKITKDTNISDVVNKLSESYNLSKTVEAAKKNISEESNVNSITDKVSQPQNNQIDFDYNVRTYEPVEQVKTNGTAEENAIFNQTLDSAVKTVENSVERYTAKLAPEGLGEIIIKMEKDSEGIVLNISATSRKTAELINSQLTDLQANLSGYNAQVNPAAVTQPQQTSEFSGYNFEQQGGQFAQQNNSDNQNGHYAYQQHTSQQEEEKSDSYVTFGKGKINTYI